MIWNDTAFIRLNQWTLNDPGGQFLALTDSIFPNGGPFGPQGRFYSAGALVSAAAGSSAGAASSTGAASSVGSASSMATC
jgi:hypothetical protein